MPSDDALKEQFSERLIQAIHENGWKFYGAGTRLAKLLNVSTKMGSTYLNGGAIPGDDKLLILAESLRVHPHWLRYGIGPKQASNAEPIAVPSRADTSKAANSDVRIPTLVEVDSGNDFGSTSVKEDFSPCPALEDQILERAGVCREQAVFAAVRGNSMEPVMPDGALTCIDRSNKAIVDGKLYALDHDGQLRIKKLVRLPGGGIRIISFNPEYDIEDYSQIELESARIKIIGRVFWYSVPL